MAKQNFYHAAADQAVRGSVVSLVRLLRRYVQGEEAQAELFDFSVAALVAASVRMEERIWFDQCVTARCLAMLGYVAVNKLPTDVQSAQPDQLATLYAPEGHATIVSLLQTAESASHL